MARDETIEESLHRCQLTNVIGAQADKTGWWVVARLVRAGAGGFPRDAALALAGAEELSLGQHVRLELVHDETLAPRVVAQLVEEAAPHGALHIIDARVIEFRALGRECAMHVEKSVH